MHKIMTKAEKQNYFDTLNKIDVSDKIEKKNGLKYLSWTWAWSEFVKRYPDAQYEIKRYDNNLPYVYDENTGYMVSTSVTIEGVTREMWLPVMDSSNKAMKSKPYSYQVKDWKNKSQNVEKWVKPATMFDINSAIMRCLVKNIAMFGLGLYIYAGEDLPEPEQEVNDMRQKLARSADADMKEIFNKQAEKDFNTIKSEFENCKALSELESVWKDNKNKINSFKKWDETRYNLLILAKDHMKETIA